MRRKAKQARRDARRRKTRGRDPDSQSPLADGLRPLVSQEHPLALLRLASSVMPMAGPDVRPHREERDDDRHHLADLVATLSRSRARETTAFLAVLAELLTDDLAARCRQEVEARDDLLPAWITGLSRVQVHSAVRLAHVLGDLDLVVIGARLVCGRELTCVVNIDHSTLSRVGGATFVPGPIDGVLAGVAERGLGPDISIVEMTVADARAWVQSALEKTVVMGEVDAWPACRPLLQWLIRHMPEGGTGYTPSEWDSAAIDELLREFFTSPVSGPFTGFEYRSLMSKLLDTGTGDPLRWSAPRIREALGWSHDDHYLSLECVLDAPDVLRAFIPFAHAKSGIREELTVQALDVIDMMRLGYKREVLREAGYWEADDQGA